MVSVDTSLPDPMEYQGLIYKTPKKFNIPAKFYDATNFPEIEAEDNMYKKQKLFFNGDIVFVWEKIN